jgi:serine/threonine protein kinase
MIGKTISHYKILAKLGEGGMGIVYKAEDTKLERLVAIKFLPHHIAASDDERERFKVEAKAAAALNHPNIATIHAIEEVDGQMFIVMEFIEGQELRKLLIDNGQLSIDNCLSYAIQIAEGLKAAHAKGITHRDIKSSNIMVTESGQVKIMDFGLAKISGGMQLTKTGTTMGTVAYMSPEQTRGAEADHRTDIWALGVVLYEMITGQLPFKGEYEAAVMYSIVNEEPEPLARYQAEVSERLQRIVDKALEKDRETRYQHVADLLADLKRGEKKNGGPVRSVLAKRRISKPTKLRFAVVAMVFVAVIIVSFYIFNRTPAKQFLPAHKQITFIGDASSPVISPDGHFIAYLTGKERKQSLMVQEIAGGRPIEVCSEIDHLHSLRWSPDGSELMVIAKLSDSSESAFLVPRLGGNFRPMPLSDVDKVCWSPDGTRMAGIITPKKRIRFINKATLDSTSISLGALEESFILLLDIDWSPLGDRLLFLTENHKGQYTIGTIKMDGSQQQQVVKDSVTLFSPRWSAHGEAIYYLRSTGEAKDLMEINVATATGKAKAPPRILQAGLQTGEHFTLSKNNQRALYTRELHYSNLWLVSPEGTGEVPTVKTKQLTTGTSWIEFQKISPDGKRVAFSMGQHPHSNIFVMPIEGGAMQQLTFLDAFNTGVAWSQNGQEIVFDSDQGGKFKVWRINSNGGTPRPFEKSEASYDAPALTWSPGFHVLYQQIGNRNFNLIHPQTEEERPLVANDSVGWMFFPRYSPDGKSVAVYWNRRKQHGAYGLWLVSLADSSQALLSKGTLIPIEWSADGKWIYAWDYRKKPREVLRISAKGGEPKPFAVLPFENITFGESIGMTTDGKHLICVVNETRSDVWLMENFAPE